jgi:hypothetical protein
MLNDGKNITFVQSDEADSIGHPHTNQWLTELVIDVGGRYAWDDSTGRLSETATAQQIPETGLGVFSARASNPVIQAVSEDADEAILWEVGSTLLPI